MPARDASSVSKQCSRALACCSSPSMARAVPDFAWTPRRRALSFLRVNAADRVPHSGWLCLRSRDLRRGGIPVIVGGARGGDSSGLSVNDLAMSKTSSTR
jgi:hypothetical protein